MVLGSSPELLGGSPELFWGKKTVCFLGRGTSQRFLNGVSKNARHDDVNSGKALRGEQNKSRTSNIGSKMTNIFF